MPHAHPSDNLVIYFYPRKALWAQNSEELSFQIQTESALKGPTVTSSVTLYFKPPLRIFLSLFYTVNVPETELALIKCLYLKEPSHSYYVKAYNNLQYSLKSSTVH